MDLKEFYLAMVNQIFLIDSLWITRLLDQWILNLGHKICSPLPLLAGNYLSDGPLDISQNLV